MEILLEQSAELIARVSLQFKRYLYNQIEWNHRLIGVKGARGTGKTTLLLQWLRQMQLPSYQAAYFTLDDLYFSDHTLVETVREYHKQGGQILVLDEVHKYTGWAREIKNIYDLFPDVQIIFTGSSVIDISRQEADLSRRVQMYELHGLSFREYLNFTCVANISPVRLESIIDPGNHIRHFFDERFRPLQHFQQYLRKGYYPFFIESGSEQAISNHSYFQRLQQLIRTIVEYDMAELKGFDIRNAKKMLQLLYIIAQQVPFKPNLSALAEKSKIHRNSMNNYLFFLESARLIWILNPAGISISTLQKPEKIYLNNPNQIFALAEETPSAGTIREVFFINQLQVLHNVRYPKKGDFFIDGKYTFEIGGKSKSDYHIADIENSWVVKDDLEYPAGHALPLWYFGLLY